jgi:hypothetical protein
LCSQQFFHLVVHGLLLALLLYVSRLLFVQASNGSSLPAPTPAPALTPALARWHLNWNLEPAPEPASAVSPESEPALSPAMASKWVAGALVPVPM